MADTSGSGPGAGKPFRKEDVYIAPASTGDDFGDDAMAARPGWPKTIGVISIIWASLFGVCCNLLGSGWALFQPSFMKMAQNNGQFTDGLPPSMMQPSFTLLGLAVVSLFIGVLLIIAGSATAARKPVGRALHLTWGVLALVVGSVGTYFNYHQQAEIHQWVRDNPGTMFAQQQSKGGGFSTVIFILVTALFMSWPIFCLIWFGLVKKNPQDIAAGVEDRAA